VTSIVLVYLTESYIWNTVICQNKYFLNFVLLPVSLVVTQTGAVEYFRKQFVSQHSQTIYQNLPYSFVSSWKVFLGGFLNPHTTYRTAHLKDSYWIVDELSVAFYVERSLILSRRAHTSAASVKSILHWKQKCFQYKRLFSCSERPFAVPPPAKVLAQQFSYRTVVQCSSPSLCGNFSDTSVMPVVSTWLRRR
jgi:hypothetical protein